jgi:hypothetical protein
VQARFLGQVQTDTGLVYVAQRPDRLVVGGPNRRGRLVRLDVPFSVGAGIQTCMAGTDWLALLDADRRWLRLQPSATEDQLTTR